ncbi:MAG TPA: HEAT repeat domain-containing protein, partial [Candidatus Thermoplasmatota archaeon]
VLSGHGGEVTAVAFTPDGRYLVSASRDQSVRVWDLQKATVARTLPHPAPVLGLALSPRGNVLISGGADRLIRAWHLDWEPEDGTGAAWDEAARPFLEAFVSVRLKPETVRGATRAAVTDAEVDALVADLRRRGFGRLRREAVAGKLLSMAAEPSSYWDEVRRSAPRVLATRPSPVVEGVARRVPWGRVALGLAALAGLVVGVSSWMKPTSSLRVVPYMAKTVLKEVDPIDLGAFSEPCPEPYDTYRELARAPEVSAPTLSCLARPRQPGTVTEYLAEAPLAAADALRDQRLYRNAVSLMLGLGEAAVEPLCGLLGDSRERVRKIAAVSLAVRAAPDATACLKAAIDQGDAVARLNAAGMIKRLLASRQLGEAEGFALLQRLSQDPDPAMRILALRALVMFNADFAVPAVSPATADSDPKVADAAREMLAEIETIRKIDLLRTGT